MWLVLHRWLGLTLGLVLMSSGLSGAMLVVARPLDEALNARLHHAPAEPGGTEGMDKAVLRVRAEFPDAELVVRMPREAGRSARVDVRGPWHGEVFIDPASGEELGRRGEREGFANALFEWHSALLTQGGGKAVLLAAGLAGLAIVCVGVVLWWPSRRWRRAFAVHWGANAGRVLLDLHRVGGALVAAFLVASLASGLYMAWRPISNLANRLAGFHAPALPRPAPATGVARLSQLLAAADAALPGGRSAIVVLPGARDRLVRVRKQMPDEPHPNGLTSVWLHPATARVMQVTPWREGGAGLVGFEYLYPLHIGALGGTPHRVLTGLTGVALFFLGASGLWLWWRRGRRLL